jgi:hypothetical protein
MAVTLTRIECPRCGDLVGFTIRGGPAHFSVSRCDPYSWAATALIHGDTAEVVGMCGDAQITEIREVLRKGNDLGYKIKWDRSNGKRIELDSAHGYNEIVGVA